jgi:hypothetical protein
MPNHVRLILAPATAEGLSRAVGEAHRRYTAFFNVPPLLSKGGGRNGRR